MQLALTAGVYADHPSLFCREAGNLVRRTAAEHPGRLFLPLLLHFLRCVPLHFLFCGTLLIALSAGFGIVSAYSSKQFDVSLFDFDLHSKFGWQLFASSLSAILAVSPPVLALCTIG